VVIDFPGFGPDFGSRKEEKSFFWGYGKRKDQRKATWNFWANSDKSGITGNNKKAGKRRGRGNPRTWLGVAQPGAAEA